MFTLHNVSIEISDKGRGTRRKRHGVRALVRAVDPAGPFGVVVYSTVNGRIDEACAEVLTGCWDDFEEACAAAHDAVLARKRAGS